MGRQDHQPQFGPVERARRTPDEMKALCGRAVAFVLDLGVKPADISAALAAALQARVCGVFVLTVPEHAAEANEAVGKASCNDGALVRVIEYDPSEAISLTRDAGNFELFEIPYGMIVAMRAAAESAFGDYEAILVMNGAQDKVEAAHLYEVCQDAREHPDAQVVASWIQWLRRPPYYLRRSFLDELDGSALTAPTVAGVKPVAHVRVRDHVFGEEQLAAPLTPPQAFTTFFDGCTMTALQAVGLARFALEHPDAKLHSPNQALSLMGPVEPAPLSDADALLVETAKTVLQFDAGLDEAEKEELAWADAFGMRNKRDFPILNDRAHAGKLVYLDSAATSQRVDVALQAQYDFDAHENANVYRGAYELSAHATFALNEARKRLEDFIGADRRQTAYVSNTSGATNLVAQAWGERNIGAGDRIICTLDAHHSNSLPFAMLAERKGAQVVYVPFDDDGRVDQAAYRAELAKGAKLVCIAQIGNVFGIKVPVQQMAKEAHDVGARVLVDAAQSFPHVKIDVRELGADWIAISAHKAYGPMGIGALWISPDAFEEMDPLGGGGGTVSHVGVDSYYLRPKSLQYEPGTPPVSQAVGWAAAIDYMDALGMQNIERHSAALTRHFVRGLGRIDGVNIIGDHSLPDGQTGLVSFTVRSVTPAEIAAFLGRLDVAVRSGGHCALPLHAAMGMIGTGRVSIGVHTTRDDIDAALVAIALCRQIYESR